MTAAEQVACDALRSAGLDELADNLEWLKQAAALRSYITEVLEVDAEESCAACGAMAGYTAHNRGCSLVPLFSTQPGWIEAQVEVAHAEALRNPWPSLLGEVPLPRTVAGRLDQAAELVRAGHVNVDDYLRVVGGDTPSLEGLIDTAAYLDPTK